MPAGSSRSAAPGTHLRSTGSTPRPTPWDQMESTRDEHRETLVQADEGHSQIVAKLLQAG